MVSHNRKIRQHFFWARLAPHILARYDTIMCHDYKIQILPHSFLGLQTRFDLADHRRVGARGARLIEKRTDPIPFATVRKDL